jgi:hypothetical protein
LLLSDPEDLGRFVDELAACRRRGQRPAGPVDDGESGGRFDLVEHLRQGAGAAVVEDAGCCGDVVVAGDAGDQLQPAQCSFAHGDRAHRRGRERGQVQVADAAELAVLADRQAPVPCQAHQVVGGDAALAG